ncbi:unnamed protein product [Jaminaea pallidilutea]
MSLPVDSGYLQTDDPTGAAKGADIPFRSILPRPDHPRIAGIESHDAHTWCQSRRDAPAPAWLINRLDIKNIERPYKGFSADGKPDPSVWKFEQDEGAPVEAACDATTALLAMLTGEERSACIRGDVADDDEFRAWSNPELYVNPVLQASLSTAGYSKAHGCMLTNAFLGELVNGRKVLNEHSYNFRLFLPADRQPSLQAPWGWTFFGHHLCIAVCFVGKRMVVAPSFSGAEPDAIDVGEHKGMRLFAGEEKLALKLMQTLPPALQKRAQLTTAMTSQEGLAEDRWNPFDERHLGGAHQDNRVVPFEGCPVSAFNDDQKSLVYDLLAAFNAYLPQQPLQHHLRRLREYEDQMYFAWIGHFGDDDAYYYRIHSPVTFCEFDFHCGIFLTNTKPAKCHIHTVNRFPNQGDYGRALIQRYRAA